MGFHALLYGLKVSTQLKVTKPLILLPLSTECCDYRLGPPLQIVFGAGIQLRALCMIGKHSANWEITLTLFLKVIEDRMFLTLIFTKMVIYH